jgi:transposase-like protein
MANRMRSAAKERFWRSKLRKWQSRGGSVREFCQREGLSEPSFYAWRKVIEERDGKLPANQAPAFLPMLVQQQAAQAGQAADFVIELHGGRRLRLPEAITAPRLAELIHALEAAELSS